MRGCDQPQKAQNALSFLCLLWLIFFVFFESGCHSNTPSADPEPGVSLSLATKRAQSIESLSYELSFTIPAALTEPITGHEVIRFSTKNITEPLVLDFTGAAGDLKSVAVAGRPSQYRVVPDHIIIPTRELASEDNAIEISFKAGDASLNRNPDFMYTLFVPARAHLAFPCFDQPNLKARFSLELTVPKEWQAVANGAETFHEALGNRSRRICSRLPRANSR
jgi:aminopeptidase N